MSHNGRRSALSIVVALAMAVGGIAFGAALPATATSNVFTFESDAVGSVPAGCATPPSRTAAAVSSTQHHTGSHSLRVHDTSSSSMTQVDCSGAPRQGGYLAFDVYPAALPNGFTFNVNGSASGTAVEVFHFAVTSTGAVQWYDGTWHALTGSGAVPVGQWSLLEISVSADDSTALVQVDHAYVGTAQKETAAGTIISSITGFGFASDGTVPSGDDVYLDDVDFATLDSIPAAGVTTRGFETDTVGTVPAGCSTPATRGAGAVSSTRAHTGTRSLRIDDTSSSLLYVVSCPAAPREGAYLSFEVYPAALPHGFSFDVMGTTLLSPSTPVSAFHFNIAPNGLLQWYDGGAWRPLAPAGTAPVGQWSKVEVSVPADNSAAHITVSGTYAGSGGPAIGNNATSHNAVTALTGYQFASNGTSTTGDDVFVDDVSFGAAADTPSTAIGTDVFGVGMASTIDDVGQVQLPSSDVVVPHGSGQRILADTPAHSDSSHTTGNRMWYSDDGGVTWASWQSHNPMPDDPSLFLTLLSNGDLLAVNYHTYMVGGSTTQAHVETAVSHDNGSTWTTHTGLLTTTTAQQSLGSSERSGVALGGFVVVHSVIEDSSGTLYLSAYGKLSGDTKYRQVLLSSTNGGVDWGIRGTIATADPGMVGTSGYEGPCEGAVEILADGSMLAVMRNGSYLPMTYSRSTDDGATWSTPADVSVGPSGQPLYSVFPTMKLLSSGKLVLLVGRPGLVLTVSADGQGDDWSTPVGIDYVNSENSAFTPLSGSEILVLGDRGRVSPWQVWARAITID
jgi:hypothetical protein